MLNLAKYRYEDSDLIRRADRQFNKIWREIRGMSLDELAPYTCEDGEIAVPIALTLKYGGSSLKNVIFDRLTSDVPSREGACATVCILPQRDENCERQQVRDIVYAQHILHCVYRSKGKRPLLLATDEELAEAADLELDNDMTGAAVREDVRRQLVNEELDHRQTESSHA